MKYFKICIFRLSLKSAGSESTAIYSGEHAHNPTIPTFPVRRGSRPKRQLLLGWFMYPYQRLLYGQISDWLACGTTILLGKNNCAQSRNPGSGVFHLQSSLTLLTNMVIPLISLSSISLHLILFLSIFYFEHIALRQLHLSQYFRVCALFDLNPI